MEPADFARLAALGWRPRIGLREGLADTCRWFLANRAGGGAPGT